MRNVIQILVLVFAILAVSACTTRTPLIPINTSFNEHIRPDFNALTPAQEGAEYKTRNYSKGDPPSELVDELFPRVAIGDEGLKHSDCLWVPAPSSGDNKNNFSLSWEVIMNFSDPDGFLSTPGRTVGACTGSDPITRMPLLNQNGGAVHFVDVSTIKMVKLRKHAVPVTQDRYSACTTMDSNTVAVETVGCDYEWQSKGRPEAITWYNGCGIFCGVQVKEDTTFELETYLTGFGFPSIYGAKTVKPNIKVVNGSRKLSRELTLESSAPNRFEFTWSVEQADSSWRENFTNQLYVSSVRVFRERDFGARIYLRPVKVEANNVDCFAETSEPTTIYIVENCSPSMRTNPAYRIINPQLPVTWQVRLAEDPLVDNFGNRNNDRLYIEFEVRTIGGQPGLRITPRKDFGFVPIGAEKKWELALENNGTAPVQVTNAELIGLSRDQFDVSIPNRSLPFDLSPGHLIPIEVTAHPTSGGNKLAFLKVSTAQMLATNSKYVQAELVMAARQGAYINVYPASLSLPSYGANWQGVRIENPTPFPYTTSILLVGRDWTHFKLLSDRPTLANPYPSAPLYRPPFTLAANTSRTFYIQHRPTGVSSNHSDLHERFIHRAQLLIGSTVKTDYTVPIRGQYRPFHESTYFNTLNP